MRVASGRLLRVLAFAASCLWAPLAAQADDFTLGLPIACTPGRDCWIANYFDRDSAPGVKDIGCGARTYDGHDGTDFALRDLKTMNADVDVVAAASGRVKAVRDGVTDVNVKIGGRQSVAGKECGNGVVVEHGGGWETQYCHMRKGSVAVRLGQEVAAGEKLGLVGLSGFTEFPHAHLTVRKDGVAVDPFDGHRADGTCGASDAPLWRPELRSAVVYEPMVLFASGLAGLVPSQAAAERGDLDGTVLSPSAPMLAMWTRALGVEPGDELTIRVTGLDGKIVFESTQKADKRQAAWFAFAARKRPPDGAWPRGAYRGEATLVRGGAKPLTRSIQAEAELR
ncbi:MAG: M23 family metallopeptidase [Alphaproteobacteria bacterium]|nr:M23 family metallopeptidase [Alphaproteobacteria bacterium]